MCGDLNVRIWTGNHCVDDSTSGSVQAGDFANVGEIERIRVRVGFDAAHRIIVERDVAAKMGAAQLALDVIHLDPVPQDPHAERHPPLVKAKNVLSFARVRVIRPSGKQEFGSLDFRLTGETRARKKMSR